MINFRKIMEPYFVSFTPNNTLPVGPPIIPPIDIGVCSGGGASCGPSNFCAADPLFSCSDFVANDLCVNNLCTNSLTSEPGFCKNESVCADDDRFCQEGLTGEGCDSVSTSGQTTVLIKNDCNF